MKKIAATGALLVAVVTVYKLAYPSVTLRYRLAIAVELNGQLKTGSGVIQVSYKKNPQVLGASARMLTEVEGDAVYVDLGQNDALFALLKEGPRNARSGPDYVVPALFGVEGGAFGPEAFSRIEAIEGHRAVPIELLPLMVRLTNTNDPKSAVLFDPQGEQPLNQNVLLKSASIEIVSAGVWPFNQLGITGVPITRGIQAKLPWLKGFKGYSSGQFNPVWTQPEKNLVSRDFSVGGSS